MFIIDMVPNTVESQKLQWISLEIHICVVSPGIYILLPSLYKCQALTHRVDL